LCAALHTAHGNAFHFSTKFFPQKSVTPRAVRDPYLKGGKEDPRRPKRSIGPLDGFFEKEGGGGGGGAPFLHSPKDANAPAFAQITGCIPKEGRLKEIGHSFELCKEKRKEQRGKRNFLMFFCLKFKNYNAL
jgi:hypothetical protein